MLLTNKLVAIADAIREKGSTTEKLTLDAMPAAIAAIETGGGGSIEGMPNPIVFTGDCSYLNNNGSYNWLFDNFYNNIEIKDITSMKYAFYYSGAERIPPISQGVAQADWEKAFYCSDARSIGAINDFYANKYSYMFAQNNYLRYLPQFTGTVRTNVTGASVNCSNVFDRCHSLREIPNNFLSALKCVGTNSTYHLYNRMLYQCHVLDEILNIPVDTTATVNSNVFSDTFYQCHRLKRITFETNSDGTPKVVKWRNQNIQLWDAVGWNMNIREYITTRYNSGITEDKQVTDEITYAALKNDKDWFTSEVYYSRFNHDSAVELINSLPDTSEHLAAQSGATNTIQFRNGAGSHTDGGSVGSLTEEEIAVAAAKGWTITYKT